MNKKIILLIIGAIVIGGVLALAFNFNKPNVASGKLSVAASFYPLYFFSQQIGGDKADVVNITPAGAEPHDYEPTAQDIATIENSNMLVLLGPALEPWGESIKQNINPQETMIIVTGEGLENQKVKEEDKTITDPHIWLSPPLAKQIVDRIAQGFIHVDPPNKEYYQANADTLKSRIDDLDGEYTQGLARCRQKDIITSHAAFGYLATQYHLRQVAISGLSPDEEPSPQQLAEVVKFSRENHITYIFFESLVNPKLSETIANEIGAKTLVLNPIEGLTPEEISRGKDYFTEMKSNLAHLQLALQCTTQ